MDLVKLLKKQKELDDVIVNDKSLFGDNHDWKTLALDVELSECANEWRGFKKWSNDQEPRTQKLRRPVMNDEDKEYYNPLLEEYVDCLHFFLSIAIEKRWQESLYIYEEAIMEIKDEGLDGDVTKAFLEVKYWLMKSFAEKGMDEKVEKTFGISKQEFCFKNAWFVFIAIGIVGFCFDLDQIENAYYDKNKVNHERQEQGY
ncbi:dUTP diphosphatase [Pseudalkalibacillus caeni]|uniref:dUTPase n=1 Tax=Exobacillus caeni TaxID=2574798 RepID=A0A5R9FDP2_9BACL|nr:dUTP diphosphatase [Pseudalkalibacillus caeni]TLS37765.1 dUTPase [Pseudalkalibacillus caeni]